MDQMFQQKRKLRTTQLNLEPRRKKLRRVLLPLLKFGCMLCMDIMKRRNLETQRRLKRSTKKVTFVRSYVVVSLKNPGRRL